MILAKTKLLSDMNDHILNHTLKKKTFIRKRCYIKIIVFLMHQQHVYVTKNELSLWICHVLNSNATVVFDIEIRLKKRGDSYGERHRASVG